VAEIDEMRDKLSILEDEIKENESKAQTLHKEDRDIPTILNDLNNKRLRARQMKDTLDDLREDLARLEDLNEVAESDDQLREMERNYGERAVQLETLAKEKVKHQAKLREDVKACRAQQDKKNTEVGRALAEKQQYESQLKTRE